MKLLLLTADPRPRLEAANSVLHWDCNQHTKSINIVDCCVSFVTDNKLKTLWVVAS